MTDPVSSLLERVRGQCPPSLLINDGPFDEDSFHADVLNLLDPQGGLALNEDSSVGDNFSDKLLQKASSDYEAIPLDRREANLVHRRAILIAVVGATPKERPSLSQALSKGYLTHTKDWLDDILSKSVGTVDLLIHLFSNLADLPVDKTVIKTSGMGKAVNAVQKHSICVGTPNESNIKDRIQQIKDSWLVSVKAKKGVGENSVAKKRSSDSSVDSPVANKKMKTETSKRAPSFSSLLQKVSKTEGTTKGAPDTGSNSSSDPGASSKTPDGSSPSDGKDSSPSKQAKKVSKRVKWADHFGGTLSAAQEFDGGEEPSETAPVGDVSVSWSDRKKRDRLREKELLARAKKSKLMDDDMGEVEMPKLMSPTTQWHPPTALPDRPDVTKPQLSSSEVTSLNTRMKNILRAVYGSEYEVPSSPAPLSDIEQALDMTSQASAVVQNIPFFVPPVQPATVDATSAAVAAATSIFPPSNSYDYSAASQPNSSHYGTPGAPMHGATPEYVQSLGLPLYLVGQDPQALQTIASTPGLLNTMVDSSGQYDQSRLMSLVQSISASNGNQTQYQQPPSNYGAAAVAPASGYGTPGQPYQSAPPPRTPYGSSNSDGNLHLSGYGPMTTEADIIALFSPYVRVREVVMKGTFSFVNTDDPVNAQRAREALTGTLLGGMPIRINQAQRKPRDSAPSIGMGAYGGGGSVAVPQPPPPPPGGMVPGAGMPPGPVNVDSVRDDRGNPATKNLFVAGYGAGTTEHQLRDLFSQHAHVIGVINKGTFSFVNTSDRAAAVRAREMLSGTMLNGGVMRINFAKETGRLGTSFDLTYGPNTGPNAARGSAGGSYYGR